MGTLSQEILIGKAIEDIYAASAMIKESLKYYNDAIVKLQSVYNPTLKKRKSKLTIEQEAEIHAHVIRHLTKKRR